MQSGKIVPTFRQFFTSALSPRSTDSNGQQQQPPPQGEPEREPTQEEALEALDLLIEQDEFRKNELCANLNQVESHWVITVLSSVGIQLRTIRGMEILRLLDKAGLGKHGHSLGRILDRRV